MASMGHENCVAVLVFDLAGIPYTTRHTATQGVNGHLKLVARLECFARPAIARQKARGLPSRFQKTKPELEPLWNMLRATVKRKLQQQGDTSSLGHFP